ncbi:MAG: hypothetical protein QM726_06240 [Chitinophagaceae bacterium]
MKQFLILLLLATTCACHAQIITGDENFPGRLRVGAAYVHDFPGVNGPGIYADYHFPLNEWIQAGVGIRHIETSGYPRSQSIKEYTKASALDLSALFVPFHTENMAFRVGLVYSFTMYNAKRGYAVYTNHDNQPADVSYQANESKGKARGMGLTAEYEYNLNERFAAGAKISYCQAYTDVLMAGPFVAIKF